MKSFDEILSELEQIATEKFDLANIRYSKTGVLGYLVYLLSYLRFDIKQYYDYLFLESNIITARTRNTLLKLASTFGYIPKFATPAIFQGNMYIYVPNSNDNNTHNIYIPKYTEFMVDNLIWTIYDTINISYDNVTNSGIANIIRNDNSRVTIPIKLQTLNTETKYIILPNPTVKQEKFSIYTYNVPFYYYGTFHKIILDATQYNGKYFSDIKVYIKTPTDTDFIEYDIVQNKYLYSGNDNVVFIEFIDESKIQIILGSGINGRYIPENSTVKIELKTTYGSVGNIGSNTEIQLLSKDKVTLDNILVTNPEFIKLVTTERLTTGSDIETLDELKKDVITYIKTRDTIVTKDDIISILSKLNIDAYTVTKTYKLFTPTIYVYSTLTGPLLLPIKHTTYYLDQTNLTNPMFIPENTQITYTTKGIYPTETNIQVVEQISDNQIKVTDTTNLNINDLIDIKNTYYVNTNDLFKITDIDTTNNIITVDKNFASDPSGQTIYKYVNYQIQCITPFIAVYETQFNRYRTYIKIDEITLNLKNLNEQNFIYVPRISINLNNITKDTTTNTYNIELEINLLNPDEIPITYRDNIADILTIYIPEINKSLTTENLSVNVTNTITYTVNDEYELFNFLRALNEIEINYTIYNSLTNNTLADYEIKTKYLMETTELINYVVDNNNIIYDIPIIEQNDYNLFKDYIKQKLLDAINNIPMINRLPGVEYKILLSNTIELSDNYTKYTDQFTNILLPLQLKIKLIIDSSKQLNNTDNNNQFTTLNDYIEYIKEELALKLLNNKQYSGIEIKYYPTQIIEFIKNIDSKYGNIIKQIEIKQPDIYIDTTIFDIDKYYETKILTKEDNLKFVPTYFWFDVNNIEIDYEVV